MNSLTPLALAAAILAAGQDGEEKEQPARPQFTISKETTRVTEHVTEDGWPDYAAAINARLGKGVTAENNAMVLLMQAMGPHPEGGTLDPKFYELLGMEPPPEKGDYLVDFYKYLRGEGVDPSDSDAYEEHVKAGEGPWKKEDHPRVAAWLEENDKPLALVAEAARRPHYFSPIVIPEEDGVPGGLVAVLLPHVQQQREFARTLVARAMLRLGEGATEAAWQDLVTCMKLGRLSGHGSTIIEGLVGIAIESVGREGTVVLLHHAPPDRKTAAAYLRDLAALPERAKMVEAIDVTERYMFLDSTLMLARGDFELTELMAAGPSPPARSAIMKMLAIGIDWDETLKMGNRFYDRFVAALREEDRDRRGELLGEVHEDLDKMAESVSSPTTIAAMILAGKDRPQIVGRQMGRVLCSLLLPALSAVAHAEERSIQKAGMLRVAVALAAWRKGHDGYPMKLTALVPDYIDELPADRFTGKSLKYKLTDDGYLLYSLGPNQKDNEGVGLGEGGPPGADDHAIRVPPQPRN